MPMPDLDPARFVPVVLSDRSHKLPMPDKGPKRFFSQDPASPETVDIFDPYYAALLADGSIRRACPVALAQAQADADAKAAEKPAGPEATKPEDASKGDDTATPTAPAA